jgi:hypothetical protein
VLHHERSCQHHIHEEHYLCFIALVVILKLPRYAADLKGNKAHVVAILKEKQEARVKQQQQQQQQQEATLDLATLAENVASLPPQTKVERPEAGAATSSLNSEADSKDDLYTIATAPHPFVAIINKQREASMLQMRSRLTKSSQTQQQSEVEELPAAAAADDNNNVSAPTTSATTAAAAAATAAVAPATDAQHSGRLADFDAVFAAQLAAMSQAELRRKYAELTVLQVGSCVSRQAALLLKQQSCQCW